MLVTHVWLALTLGDLFRLSRVSGTNKVIRPFAIDLISLSPSNGKLYERIPYEFNAWNPLKIQCTLSKVLAIVLISKSAQTIHAFLLVNLLRVPPFRLIYYGIRYPVNDIFPRIYHFTSQRSCNSANVYRKPAWLSVKGKAGKLMLPEHKKTEKTQKKHKNATQKWHKKSNKNIKKQ